jgi:hypothetical protein
MLLWGTAGCGKTHFANTAPGKRLFLNFDPDGTASLPLDEDTLLLDYSQEPDSCVSQVQSTLNPYNLDTLLKQDPSISTVIVDSVTAFTSKAVAHSLGHRSAPGAVFENPGPAGYGFRNRHALGLAKSMLLVTARHNRNVIFICHEDVPVMNDKGVVIMITLLLGGSLREEVPIHISEVWHMQDKVDHRVVQVRSGLLYRPMKSRMFDTTYESEFIVSNKASPSKVTLASQFQRWRDAKYEKIKVPT